MPEGGPRGCVVRHKALRISCVRLLAATGATCLAAPCFADDFSGAYVQPAKDYSQHARISRDADGRYRVLIHLNFHGCGGRLEATGHVEDGALIVEKGDACRLTIKHEPPGVHIFEDFCAPHHGKGCEFSGFLTKKP